MRFLISAAFAAVTLGAGEAAAGDWYGRIEGGFANEGRHRWDFTPSGGPAFSEDSDSSLAAGVAVGRDFGAVSLEAELIYVDTTLFESVDEHVKTWGVVFNGRYDLDLGGGFTPFVLVGAGPATASVNDYRGEFESSGLLWHAGAGAAFDVGAGELDVGVRHVSAPEITMNVSGEFKLKSESRVVFIGLRFPVAIGR